MLFDGSLQTFLFPKFSENFYGLSKNIINGKLLRALLQHRLFLKKNFFLSVWINPIIFYTTGRKSTEILPHLFLTREVLSS